MFTPTEVRDALGAGLSGVRDGAREGFSAIANDSRITKPGELFVALETEVRDGHEFVADAVAHGAAGVVVHKDVVVPDDVTVFTVEDTRYAIGELAHAWRERFPFLKTTVIAGNVGKTTTKELTAALLGRYVTVLKSHSNFNDEVGLSMTVFQLSDAYQAAVFEVGMDRLGEIRRLCEISRPETAVVLNVGPTHLEKLGSMEAIAQAKGEAVEALGEWGTAILNADDPYVSAMASRTRARVLTFGIEKHADVRATDIKTRGLSGVDFNVAFGGRSVAVHSPLPGERLVANALAALTVAFSEGISLEEAVFGLSQVSIPTRLQSRMTAGGAVVLDDSYNAGPASMLAALGVLSETLGRRIALLGDMLELGSAEEDSHRMVGERAAEVADLLFTIGPRGSMISDAARAAGLSEVEHFSSKEEALETMKELLGPGDVLLVKASHGLALWTVVEALVN